MLYGVTSAALLIAANGFLNITTKAPSIEIKGDNNVVTARELFYDVAAFCNQGASVVRYGVATELGDKEYVISQGTEQVRWKATPGNFAAMRYWLETDGQHATPVEMTRSAVACAEKKVKP